MTRFKVQDKRYKIPQIKSLREYDDKFPSDGSPKLLRLRLPSCPDVLPSYRDETNTASWEDPLPRPHGGSGDSSPSPYTPMRRHSWSVGVSTDTGCSNNNNIFSEIANSPNMVFTRKISSESRRSSVASVPEPIEECSSGEETDDNSSVEYDYMNCANCSPMSQKQTNSLLETSSSSPMKYCYKCKHLFQIKTAFQNTDSRHSSISSESYTNSPRRSRRTSLTDDLPVIAEPYSECEANDTKELQISVEKEVNKLVKFKRACEMQS